MPTIRKLILYVLAGLLGYYVLAYDNGPRPAKQDDRYCAKMMDGIMKVIHEGEVISNDVILADGSELKRDGTLIRKDGTRISLKEGECVNKDWSMSERPANEIK